MASTPRKTAAVAIMMTTVRIWEISFAILLGEGLKSQWSNPRLQPDSPCTKHRWCQTRATGAEPCDRLDWTRLGCRGPTRAKEGCRSHRHDFDKSRLLRHFENPGGQ